MYLIIFFLFLLLFFVNIVYFRGCVCVFFKKGVNFVVGRFGLYSRGVVSFDDGGGLLL